MFNKYLKYKLKYLNLKKQLGGDEKEIFLKERGLMNNITINNDLLKNKCKFYYGDTGEYKKIFSISLFTKQPITKDMKLTRKFYAYTTGIVASLNNVNKVMNRYNKEYIVRLYINNNIIKNLNKNIIMASDQLPFIENMQTHIDQFFSVIMKKQYLQIVLYDCDSKYDVGTFGTLIRFLPFFEDNFDEVHIRDTDSSFGTIMDKYNIDKLFNKNSCNIFYTYATYYPKHIEELYNRFPVLIYELLTISAPIASCIGGKSFSKYDIPINKEDLLNKMLMDCIDFKDENNEICGYGIDEIYLTRYIVQIFIEYGKYIDLRCILADIFDSYYDTSEYIELLFSGLGLYSFRKFYFGYDEKDSLVKFNFQIIYVIFYLLTFLSDKNDSQYNIKESYDYCAYCFEILFDLHLSGEILRKIYSELKIPQVDKSKIIDTIPKTFMRYINYKNYVFKLLNNYMWIIFPTSNLFNKLFLTDYDKIMINKINELNEKNNFKSFFIMINNEYYSIKSILKYDIYLCNKLNSLYTIKRIYYTIDKNNRLVNNNKFTNLGINDYLNINKKYLDKINNIVKLKYYEIINYPFKAIETIYAYDYIEGETLNKASINLTREQFNKIILQALNILIKLNEFKCVYVDIQLENIIYNKVTESIYLIDSELVCTFDRTIIQLGKIIPDINFSSAIINPYSNAMSLKTINTPIEQILNKDQYKSLDIYCFGIVFIEMMKLNKNLFNEKYKKFFDTMTDTFKNFKPPNDLLEIFKSF